MKTAKVSERGMTFTTLSKSTSCWLLIFLACFPYVHQLEAQKTSEQLPGLKKCWEASLPFPLPGMLRSDSSQIYLSFEGGMINALEASSGRVSWTAEMGGQITSNLLIRELDILIVTSPVGKAEDSATALLRSISKETGISNWTVKLNSSGRAYLGLASSGIVLVFADGTVELRKEREGDVLWRRPGLGSVISTPLINQTSVTVPVSTGRIFALSASDGTIQTTFSGTFPATAIAWIGDSLIAGDARGNLVSYDIKSGKKLWRFKAGAKVDHVSAASGRITAVSADNFVYMLRPYRGDVIWKRRLAARISGAPSFNDNVLLTTANGENSAYILDLASGRFLNQLSLQPDSAFAAAPVLIADDRVAAVTNGGISMWSFNECFEHKNAALTAPQS